MAPLSTVLESGLGPRAPHHLSEVLVGIVLLLLIFLALWKVVVPAFEGMYQERSDKIEGGMQRAARAEADAKAALDEYNEKLATAREEAAKIREDAKNSSAQILAEARDQASAEKARIVASGRTQLAAEREHLIAELRRDIGGLATTLAEKIVGESLADDARTNRTVDRFLDELETTGTKA
ncbi:MAG: F0F1 ATP synthase subunit B [Arachnia sp.]